MNNILIRPLVTEKLTAIQEKLNRYTFEVDINSTKSEIKAAVEAAYPEVNVIKVNTIIMPSKPKGRFTKGGYISGRTKKVKKAIVTIKGGQEIDFFSEI
jgi:large subunit ribosomal protein L23